MSIDISAGGVGPDASKNPTCASIVFAAGAIPVKIPSFDQHRDSIEGDMHAAAVGDHTTSNVKRTNRRTWAAQVAHRRRE